MTGCFQTMSSVLLISIISAAECVWTPFLCGSGEVISWERVCDGLPQCQDGSDEGIDCVCGSDQWQCTSGQCIPAEARCNMFHDCYDSSDEILCPECSGFQCNTSLCLWEGGRRRCNGVFDCSDLGDEMGCSHRAGSWMCNNTVRIHQSRLCDGVDDCGDNSDEASCAPVCRGIRTSCSDGHCIMRKWWCDGYEDCQDGSDELDCGTCQDSEFMCDNYQCVALSAVCDGVLDCKTGEDEVYCFSLSEENSGSLWARYKGQDYVVCSDEWTTDLAVQICSDIDQLQLAGWNEMAPSSCMTRFAVFNDDTLGARTTNLAVKTSCESGKIINLTCHQDECGHRQAPILQSFVAGGQIVSPGMWPWVISLLYLGKFICGGSLISESWIITAAHCILDASGSGRLYNFSSTPFYFEVVLGSTHHFGLSSQGTPYRVRVSQIHLFPNLTRLLNGGVDWDVALLKLPEPVSYTDYIQPVCLPHQGQTISLTSLCYLAGWGKMTLWQDLAPEYLRETRMQLWSDARCARNTVPRESVVNTNSTLCGGFPLGIPTSCKGDSGGPVMCLALTGRWVLTGLMSQGSVPCASYHPTVRANRFARVANVVDWIRQQIAEA